MLLINQKLKNKDTFRHRMLSKERTRTHGQHVVQCTKEDNYNIRHSYNIQKMFKVDKDNKENYYIDIENKQQKRSISMTKIRKDEYTPRVKQNSLKSDKMYNNNSTSSPAKIVYNGENKEIVLYKCDDCGRNFNENALEKHIKICKKVFLQKRNKFDSKQSRQTEEQIDIENKNKNSNYNKKSKKMNKEVTIEEKPLKKIPKWKLQSEQFRRAMTNGRGPSKSSMGQYSNDQMNNEYDDVDDREMCSFCNRKFNLKALDRHKPFCEDKHKRGNIRVTKNKLKK